MEIYDFIAINFAAGVGILFLFIFVFTNTTLNKQIRKIFFTLIMLELLELIFYSLELWTATFAEPVMARTLLSALGYAIRPMLLYLILLLMMRNCTNKKHFIVLAIPLVINTLIVCSAFFIDVAFSYDEANVFVRGPLGYTTHFVLFLYLLLILVRTLKEYGMRNAFESAVICTIVGLVTFSIIVEAVYSVRNIGKTVIVLSTVAYYMFFQTQIFRETMADEQNSREIFEEKSKIDGTTGLLNKNTFFDVVNKALQSNTDGGVALLFLDLDHFKDVNDRLGHLVGDEVIRATAKKLQNVFRNSDIICRFGGDEFCVFTQGVPKEVLSHRLNEMLLALQIEYLNETDVVKTTASIGAVYCAEAITLDFTSLLKLADGALYEAKNSGRNHYVIKEYTG